MLDLARLKEGQKWMWALGDYGEVARYLEPHAEALAAAVLIEPGMSVLDVAAGNGNFAVAAARRGASVVATDLTPEMIRLGQARTVELDLDITWQEADAEELPFADDRFDVVASVFGAMFAPRPERVATELFRVLKPDGVVAMANYAHAGFLGSVADLMATYSFAPPGGVDLPSPFLWGDPSEIRRQFEGKTSSLRLEERTVTFSFPTLQAGVEFWERTNAPLMALKAMLAPARFREAVAAIAALMERTARETDDGVALDSQYLQVVARKPKR